MQRKRHNAKSELIRFYVHRAQGEGVERDGISKNVRNLVTPVSYSRCSSGQREKQARRVQGYRGAPPLLQPTRERARERERSAERREIDLLPAAAVKRRGRRVATRKRSKNSVCPNLANAMHRMSDRETNGLIIIYFRLSFPKTKSLSLR